MIYDNIFFKVIIHGSFSMENSIYLYETPSFSVSSLLFDGFGLCPRKNDQDCKNLIKFLRRYQDNGI